MRIVATHGADLAWGAAPAYDIVSQMDTDTEHALGGAISPTAGVPLRVAVYMRIDEAIRTGALPRASLIPSEAELGGRFNVSRTVIREALLLLEEDGLVHSRRGIGRFVSDHPPRSGIERLEPLERLISAGRPVRITRTEHTEQTSTSSFVTDFLGGDGHSSSWFIESVIGDGSGPIALTQEHLPASERLDGPLSPLRDVLASLPADATFLGAAHAAGLRFSGTSEITTGTAGATRATLLGIPAAQPIPVLTRYLRFDGRPAFLSKSLINQHETTISITHHAY